MRTWPRRAYPHRPQTYVGQWLRAGLLNQRELRNKLGRTLNGGKPGWNYDEPAVVEAVCVLAVRKLFPTGADDQTITAFVSDIRGRIHSVAPPGQLETEALLRATLGDPDVAISHIESSEIFQAQGAMAAVACIKLGLDEQDIDQLIVEGEQLALANGWHPPLAS